MKSGVAVSGECGRFIGHRYCGGRSRITLRSIRATCWDGADIKSNYAKHVKVRAGIHFGDPAHNIYGIESKDAPAEEWWRDAQGKKTKLRGKWNYKYESTAAHGGTIFWKYSPDFLADSGNKEFQ